MDETKIFNVLCEIFFAEEVRLMNKISDLERFVKSTDFDEYQMIELIETKSILRYFRKYMLDVLRYLQYFEK